MEGLRELRIRGSRAGRMEYQRQIHRQEATKEDCFLFFLFQLVDQSAHLFPRGISWMKRNAWTEGGGNIFRGEKKSSRCTYPEGEWEGGGEGRRKLKLEIKERRIMKLKSPRSDENSSNGVGRWFNPLRERELFNAWTRPVESVNER